MSKYITIQVSGRVQGVWFRKSAKNFATELGISGFVHNNEDGTVTLEACGNKEKINQLLSWSYKGSTLAKVDNVNYEIIDKVTCKKNNFEIL